MDTFEASEFNANCLALIDRVARTGESITINRNGRPIAELRPCRPPRADSLIGLHRGLVKISGDIVEPLG